ncbi:MAG TPA: hypothetical protein VFF33_09695 [Ignavibacteriaceae bacterium]|nr:hypothetical protein [Ignavibacteriaceae bacterium]
MTGITFEEPKCSACVHKVNAKELSKIIFTSDNKCCQQFVIDKNIVEKYIASYKLNITEDIFVSDIILSDEISYKEFQPLTNTPFNLSTNNLYIKNSVLLI